MPARPVIGVTTTLRGGWRGFLFNRMTVRLAGAEAKRLHAGKKPSLAGLHGLIIGGGDDIGSELYGGKPDAFVKTIADYIEFSKKLGEENNLVIE